MLILSIYFNKLWLKYRIYRRYWKILGIFFLPIYNWDVTKIFKKEGSMKLLNFWLKKGLFACMFFLLLIKTYVYAETLHYYDGDNYSGLRVAHVTTKQLMAQACRRQAIRDKTGAIISTRIQRVPVVDQSRMFLPQNPRSPKVVQYPEMVNKYDETSDKKIIISILLYLELHKNWEFSLPVGRCVRVVISHQILWEWQERASLLF